MTPIRASAPHSQPPDLRLYIEVARVPRDLRRPSVEHSSIAHAIHGQTPVGGGWR